MNKSQFKAFKDFLVSQILLSHDKIALSDQDVARAWWEGYNSFSMIALKTFRELQK